VFPGLSEAIPITASEETDPRTDPVSFKWIGHYFSRMLLVAN